MADCWVRVGRSDGGGVGDNVYVDGNYVDPAGVVGMPFLTDTGQHTFETIDPAGQPIWHNTQTIYQPLGNSERHPVPVTLAPTA